jgi:hypothetical protein
MAPQYLAEGSRFPCEAGRGQVRSDSDRFGHEVSCPIGAAPSGARSKIAGVPDPPRVVAWTAHARVKAELLGVTRVDVEDAVLERYDQRTRNTRSADWLVTAGSLAVAFNHPDEGDTTAARVVTLWRQD